LDGRRTRKRVGYRAEIRKHGISRVVNDPTLMLLHRVADCVEVLAQSAVGALLILSSEARVTHHIRVQNGCELSR
jgi:hypothetical protein